MWPLTQISPLPFNNRICLTRSCNHLELSALLKLFDQTPAQFGRAISAGRKRRILS